MLDLYIEVSILLTVMLLFWHVIQFFLDQTGIQTNHRWQQTSLRLLLVLVLTSPLLVRALPPEITVDSSNSGRSMTFNYFSHLANADIISFNPANEYIDIDALHNGNPLEPSVLKVPSIDVGGRKIAGLDSKTFSEVAKTTWPWKPSLQVDKTNGHSAVKNSQFELLKQQITTPWKWLLFIVFLLCFSRQLLRWLKQLKQLNSVLQGSHRWKKSGSVNLLLSETIDSPFATALWRKKFIVIPVSLLFSKTNLRLTIAHEAQHLRNGDLYWEWVLNVLKLVLFWNPAVYLWKHEEDRLRELACDEFLVSKRGVSAHSYGHCLLQVAESAIKLRQGLPSTVSMCSPLGLKPKSAYLKQRIQLLGVFNQSKHVFIKTIVLVSPLLLLTLLLSIFTYAKNGWSMTSSQPTHRLGDMHVSHANNRLQDYPTHCATWITTQLNLEGSLVRQCANLSAHFSVENDYNLTQISDDKGNVLLKAEPYLPELSFPLTVGKKWQKQYTGYQAHYGSSGVKNTDIEWLADMQCNVVTYATTRIKVGNFQAYKIECRETFLEHPTLTGKVVNKTFWYSPSAKMIIKRTSDDFSLNKEIVRILLK